MVITPTVTVHTASYVSFVCLYSTALKMPSKNSYVLAV